MTRRAERPATGTPATVRLLPDPEAGPVSPSGPAHSIQEAELVMPAQTLAALWNAEHLERLAAAYWRYLTRASHGLIKVGYETDSRTVMLGTRRLPLLRFHAPEYLVAPQEGSVSWPIDRGLLVARAGRGRGYLRISVWRVADGAGDASDPETATIRVRAEVANFFPLLRGNGRFARLGVRLYSATQLRIHVLVTRGFLRSLEALDLPPSRVGAMRSAGG